MSAVGCSVESSSSLSNSSFFYGKNSQNRLDLDYVDLDPTHAAKPHLPLNRMSGIFAKTNSCSIFPNALHKGERYIFVSIAS